MKWTCTCGAISYNDNTIECPTCCKSNGWQEEKVKELSLAEIEYNGPMNVAIRLHRDFIYEAAENYVKNWGSLSTHDWNTQATFRAGVDYGFKLAYFDSFRGVNLQEKVLGSLKAEIEVLRAKLAEYTDKE